MSKGLVRVVQVVAALALPLVLLTGNIQLLAHPRFARYEYQKAGFPPDRVIPPGGYPLTKAERMRLADAALRSIVGPEGMRALEEARFEETGAPAFNAREIRHMRDVRWLFSRARALFWVAVVALVGGVGLLAWWGRRNARGLQPAVRPILTSVTVTLALAGALGLYVLLSFGSFFTRFHRLFFEGETWLFRQDDTLIRLFPSDFWFDAALIIAGLTVFELLLVGLLAWWLQRAPAQATAEAARAD